MGKRRKKFSSFGDYVLNDKSFVLPFLMALSVHFTVFLFLVVTIMMWVYSDNLFFQFLFTLMLVLSCKKLYKYHKFGGWKNTIGLSTNEVVWGDKIGKN